MKRIHRWKRIAVTSKSGAKTYYRVSVRLDAHSAVVMAWEYGPHAEARYEPTASDSEPWTVVGCAQRLLVREALHTEWMDPNVADAAVLMRDVGPVPGRQVLEKHVRAAIQRLPGVRVYRATHGLPVSSKPETKLERTVRAALVRDRNRLREQPLTEYRLRDKIGRALTEVLVATATAGGPGLAELAADLKWSETRLVRVLAPQANERVTLRDVVRVADALGVQIDVTLAKR